MKCEVCGEQKATVHVTQVVDGKVRELHLCEECAEQGGVNVQNAMSLPDLLLGMGKEDAPAAAGEDRACPNCHMRRSDFKKTSRLGCPTCYATFAEELQPLLASLHKGLQHVGKVPVWMAADLPRSMEDLAALQEKLGQAVDAERYEEAARLRDLIRNAQARQKSVPVPEEGQHAS